jgi:hypothetical protein
MDTTSVSGTQQVTQSAWDQLQFQQAKQFAERAAQNARLLQAKARDAQTAADQAQENARVLGVKADQAQGVAVQADRNVRSSEASAQISLAVTGVVAEAVQTVQAQQPAQVQAAPTVNTQGETIGTVVNVTA